LVKNLTIETLLKSSKLGPISFNFQYIHVNYNIDANSIYHSMFSRKILITLKYLYMLQDERQLDYFYYMLLIMVSFYIKQILRMYF